MDSERMARVVALLEDCVRTEIEVMNGGYNLGLTSEQVENLMFGITSGVLYGFSVDWRPDWVRAGDLHSWIEGDAHLARCPVCLLESPGSTSAQEAGDWVRRHMAEHPRSELSQQDPR